MKALFTALLHTPGPSTPLSRFTAACGVFYVGCGVVFYAAPELSTSLLGVGPLQGQERALVQVVGVLLAVVGWFYLMGARTRATSFGLATVVDRLLVPVVVLPLIPWSGAHPGLVVPFAILDPLLALVAYGLWRRERA